MFVRLMVGEWLLAVNVLGNGNVVSCVQSSPRVHTPGGTVGGTHQ